VESKAVPVSPPWFARYCTVTEQAPIVVAELRVTEYWDDGKLQFTPLGDWAYEPLTMDPVPVPNTRYVTEFDVLFRKPRTIEEPPADTVQSIWTGVIADAADRKEPPANVKVTTSLTA